MPPPAWSEERSERLCCIRGSKWEASCTATHLWEQRIYKCFSEKSDVCYGWGKAGTTGWSHLILAQENCLEGQWNLERVLEWGSSRQLEQYGTLWNQDLSSVKTQFTWTSTAEQGAPVAAGERPLHIIYQHPENPELSNHSYTSKKCLYPCYSSSVLMPHLLEINNKT